MSNRNTKVDGKQSSPAIAKLPVSRCCNSSDLIEPDWEAAEEAGSLWMAYACYICKKCGKACEVDEQ